MGYGTIRRRKRRLAEAVKAASAEVQSDDNTEAHTDEKQAQAGGFEVQGDGDGHTEAKQGIPEGEIENTGVSGNAPERPDLAPAVPAHTQEDLAKAAHDAGLNRNSSKKDWSEFAAKFEVPEGIDTRDALADHFLGTK